MMINLPRDDLGAQSLREENAVRAYAPVATLRAATMVGAQASRARAVPAAVPEERRRGERRRGRRRGEARPAILLDTRGHNERRLHERRGGTDRGRQYQALGVDIRV